MSKSLQLSWTPTIQYFIESIVRKAARETAVYGTRGDGKTQGVFGAMLAHAALHQQLGYKLPVPWIGVTDTFQSHKLKTLRSLEDPMWGSCWQVKDSGHVAEAYVGGRCLVRLDLFGIEDQGAMNRVRMETVGVWFEEPAPTGVLQDSSGVKEDAWAMAMTSQRIPSYHHPAIMTLNYPDEDHWTWQRFLPVETSWPILPAEGPERDLWYDLYGHMRFGRHPSEPSRLWVQVPPGERASAQQRKEWMTALKDRPDLLRRLLAGKPGSLQMGAQVADGFRADLHVAQNELQPIPYAPLTFGVDFGLTPTIVLGQPDKGRTRVLAAFSLERGGIKQLLESEVLPWLSAQAPWALRQPALVRGVFDPAGETPEQADIDRSPVQILETLLPGHWFPGPVNWDVRRHVLITALNQHTRPGEVTLQIDPIHGRELIKALTGRWHYVTDRTGQVRRDLPKKPNHPWEDYGDALIYFLWAMQAAPVNAGPVEVETAITW